MTTTNPTTTSDREALEIELEEITDDLDALSIIGAILTITDYLEIDAAATLKGDHSADRQLLFDLIEQSQSAGIDAALPNIIRAIEIDEIMLSLED